MLNASWLRTEIAAGPYVGPCLEAWDEGYSSGRGYRAGGMAIAATEAAAMCGGGIAPGAPTTASFIHGFFSVAQLGQFAVRGLSLVARWGIPDLLDMHGNGGGGGGGGGGGDWDPKGVAADLFLYTIYKRTMGAGVLHVASSSSLMPSSSSTSPPPSPPALVYAHCASGTTNGSITVMAANPSNTTVMLTLPAGVPPRPRLEYVLTAPWATTNWGRRQNLSAHTPVLNGRDESPLMLAADGSLPAMEPRYCGDRRASPFSRGGGGLQRRSRLGAVAYLSARPAFYRSSHGFP